MRPRPEARQVPDTRTADSGAWWRPSGASSPAVTTPDGALDAAVAAIGSGGVIAVQGAGGYQLTCDATDEVAVARLRAIAGRPTGPLAVLVPGLSAARALAHVSPAEARLLTAPARPVVLLRRRDTNGLSPSVCAGLPDVGLLLPACPLHHLLLHALASTDHRQRRRLLAVTSGGPSGAPAGTGEAATATPGPAVAGVLGHDRTIRVRCADAVTRVVAGRAALVRRARGEAPAPLPLPVPVREPVVAVGARSADAAVLAVDGHVVVGPHRDGGPDPSSLDAFADDVARLCRSRGVTPRVVAHDPHPGYVSTRYGLDRFAAPRRIAVQHQHAHVAAVAAEHGLTDDFLGVSYDWPGLGDDGTLWGGEILRATFTGYRRLGRFALAAVPGGASSHRPARTALGYLYATEDLGSPRPDPRLAGDLLGRLGREETEIVRRMVRHRASAPPAGSCGALFDAVAALLGLCDQATYEGEAAVLLEAAAAPYLYAPALPWVLTRRDGVTVYDPAPTLRAVLTRRQPAGWVAAAFHTTITEVTGAMVAEAAARTGVRAVCLGGDLFTNRRLTVGLLDQLGRLGLKTYTAERVPVDDSGIGYGQAVVAAARLAAG